MYFSLKKLFRSGSTLQNDVLAVLAAVSELIKEKNGSETDVKYFAALLSTLKSTSKEEPSRIAAVAYLISLIVKKVNKEVVRRCFSTAIEV